MTWTDALMYGVILWAAYVTRLRSPVVLILCVWWLAGMAAWFAAGYVPVPVAVALDLAAFFFVAWKAACLTDITIAMIFAPSIYAHVVLPQYEDWAVSLALGSVQFLLAGWSWRRLKSWEEVSEARRALYRDLDETLRAALKAVRFGV